MPVAFVALGVLARLRQWAGGRSLWLDEVLIADNLVQRGFGELASKPLLHFQVAPLLWSWLERLSVTLLGSGERALRLVPLLAGIAVVLVTWVLARRLLPEVLVPVAVLLVALHPALIYYSNEVKQYSTDVLVVLLLVLLAQHVAGHADVGPALRRLSLAGVVAVWLSLVAVLPLAGITLVLLIPAVLARDPRRALRIALVLSPWLVSFLLSYAVTLHSTESSIEVSNYWRHTYPHSVLELPGWFVSRWYDLAHLPLRMTLRVLGLLLLAIGLGRLLLLGRRWAVLLWAPVPLAVLAAAVHTYPFADRLALWLVPLAALALAAALPHRLEQGALAWLLIGTAMLTVVMGPAMATGLLRVVQVQEVEELEPLLHELASQRQLSDIVLVEIGSQGAFDYYARRVGVSRDGVILFASRAGTAPCNDRPALETGRFFTDRVWVVSSHRLAAKERLGTLEDMLSRIRTVSHEVRHLHDTSADAYLFDPAAGAQTDAAKVPQHPERCLSVVRSTR
ncbi:MAG: glycosyltransferase family 39 protein [Frankiaceae bacterium]|nr:glycosyltransferase family 39 protein [Frankiaceae bacterium]